MYAKFRPINSIVILFFSIHSQPREHVFLRREFKYATHSSRERNKFIHFRGIRCYTQDRGTGMDTADRSQRHNSLYSTVHACFQIYVTQTPLAI